MHLAYSRSKHSGNQKLNRLQQPKSATEPTNRIQPLVQYSQVDILASMCIDASNSAAQHASPNEAFATRALVHRDAKIQLAPPHHRALLYNENNRQAFLPQARYRPCRAEEHTYFRGEDGPKQGQLVSWRNGDDDTTFLACVQGYQKCAICSREAGFTFAMFVVSLRRDEWCDRCRV